MGLYPSVFGTEDSSSWGTLKRHVEGSGVFEPLVLPSPLFFSFSPSPYESLSPFSS